jgi:hypothetical protein
MNSRKFFSPPERGTPRGSASPRTRRCGIDSPHSSLETVGYNISKGLTQNQEADNEVDC